VSSARPASTSTAPGLSATYLNPDGSFSGGNGCNLLRPIA